MMRPLYSLLLLFALLPGIGAAQSPSDLATRRAGQLQRGVNASMWFAQAEDYAPARLRSYTTDADIALMHSMGFDHVRLSIDADELLRNAPPEGLNPVFVAELDRAIHTMLQDHLCVIVDIHPADSFKQRLRTDNAADAQFFAMWKALASHYANSDPDRIFFEVLNEPQFTDEQHWHAFEAHAIATIRSAAPRHTIIATAAHYSGLTDLLALEPFSDPDIIYTFHDYEPFAFTHQGATWTMPQVRPLRAVPYPSSPESVASNLSEEQSLLDQHWINAYGLDRWNAQRIDSELSFAAKWGALHHVPVYCGEFGVYRTYADPAMRAAWLRDMRTALERHGIGWAVWDYQGGFAVVTRENGKATPIPAVADALGLRAQ